MHETRVPQYSKANIGGGKCHKASGSDKSLTLPVAGTEAGWDVCMAGLVGLVHRDEMGYGTVYNSMW
jgi:hypothetical protein